MWLGVSAQIYPVEEWVWGLGAEGKWGTKEVGDKWVGGVLVKTVCL